jgi:hypothetical protein
MRGTWGSRVGASKASKGPRQGTVHIPLAVERRAARRRKGRKPAGRWERAREVARLHPSRARGRARARLRADDGAAEVPVLQVAYPHRLPVAQLVEQRLDLWGQGGGQRGGLGRRAGGDN